MSSPIVDFHCDLLAYLAENPQHTPHDAQSLTSLEQLQKGRVAVQILALFTETGKDSNKKFNAQIHHYNKTLFSIPRLKDSQWETLERLHVSLSIENASGLLEEDEPLDLGLSRLKELQKSEGPIFYTSLTWNTENRFGGGNKTKIGLKRDGEILLDHLNELGIPIDLSHTSDPLADDILNYIYKKSLKVPAIASHSNFRAVHNMARNLPNDVACEIHRLGGIIGLNLFAPFIGPSAQTLVQHIELAEALGIQKSLVFGADFFNALNIPLDYPRPLFFEEIANASAYPNVLQMIPARFHGIAHKNGVAFIERLLEATLKP